jgi:hypothetical protein
MRTSTDFDVHANIDELILVCEGLLNLGIEDEDWWDGWTIGDITFDINIYDTDRIRTGEPIRLVSIYPVAVDQNGTMSTDTSDFVTVLEQDLTTKKIKKLV